MGGDVASKENGIGMRMELLGNKEVEMVEFEEINEKEMEKKTKNGDSAVDNSSAIVRRERFLPKMELRVLLVEADDSTRQIIAALLRKCSYKVAAVSDGLKAWEVLKGRPHNIDLILTEVDLPSISGFALLTLIMEHDICKNIPVIMMSSQDSVSTVYKCMLRGAADFLVKPVRKNELRNLWQHVWRRQALSSAGPGPPDESVAQQKDEATAENNAISNYSSDYTACIQRNRECIEKGTDAQSSCTKPELDAEETEIECLQDFSTLKRSKPLSSNMDVEKYEEYQPLNEKVKQYRNEDQGSREASGIDDNTMTCGQELVPDDPFKQFHAIGQAYVGNGVLANSFKEAIDLIGAFDNYLKNSIKSSGSNNRVESLPLLDLSLRSHPSSYVNQITDDRRGLKQSDASAFSRYVNKTVQPRHSTTPSTCNQQNDHITETDKQSPNHIVNHTSLTPELTINSPNHINFAAAQSGETETQFPSHQQILLHAPIPVRGIRFQSPSNAYGSMMSPAFCAQSSPSPMQSPASGDHQEASFQVNSFHLLNHQTGDSKQFPSLANQNEIEATDNSENSESHKMESGEERGHFSFATDRNPNSSFCNDTLTHLHNLGCGGNDKTDTVSYMSTECINGENFRVKDGQTLRSAQREAALNKFRLKRKERCFEKKVRYESRKKLAEKRPRVKGQFVRQMHNESPSGTSSVG